MTRQPPNGTANSWALEPPPADLELDSITLTPNPDKLDRLRDMVRQARDLELRKAELEEELEEIARQLNGKEGLYFRQLPELMGEINMPAFTLGAEGNMPAFEAKSQPFYAANIAAGWPEEKRSAGFAYLDSTGHGDLIKTEVTVAFPREDRAKAKKFLELAKKYGTPQVSQSVHNQTLTAWLKEQVEDKHTIPDLAKIGGTVTRVVKLKAKRT